MGTDDDHSEPVRLSQERGQRHSSNDLESGETNQSSKTKVLLPPHDASLPLVERLSHFTWAWFECTMSTGAIATLLSQQPKAFGFTGLLTIGKIFFILDLVLFVLFVAAISTRFWRRPSDLVKSFHHPHESFFLGTALVSVALILYCAQQYGVPACGPWLVKALEVAFWIYAALALLVAVFQYHVIFDEENLPVVDALPAWILPLYPFIILGPLAGVLLQSQPQTAALPIFVGALMFQGLGWMFAFMIFTIYLTRLINSDLPVESKRPAMFVAVGPAAYTANTLVALGTRAPYVIPDHWLKLDHITVGEVWKAFAVPCAFFLWLLAFWFFAITLVSVISGARRMRFTMSFWAFIFPNVGLTIAAIYIGDVLDSDGIRGVCTAMTLALVIVWLYVAVMNIKAVWQRKVLWPGMDEDMEDIEGHRQDGVKGD